MTLLQRIRARIAASANEKFDANGKAILDPKPIEVPVALMQRQMSINEQIARALRSRDIVMAQEARGEETLEDMLDFGNEEADDGLPVSPHEIADMKVDEVNNEWKKLDAARSRALRESKKPVPQDGQRGAVRRDEGRPDVSGAASGSGAPAVRPVEPPAGV